MNELEFFTRLGLPYLKQWTEYAPWLIGAVTAYLVITRVYWTKIYGFEATRSVPLAWPVTVPFDLAIMVLANPILGFRIRPSRLKIAEKKIECLENQEKELTELVEKVTELESILEKELE